MRILIALAALALTLTFPLLARDTQAHSRLETSAPAPDSTVSVAPSEVRIWFTQELTLRGNDIVVTDAAGNRVDMADARVDQSDPDRKQLAVTLWSIPDGAYTVTWTSSSAEDGHSATESYTFYLAAAPAEAPAEEAPIGRNCPNRAA